MSTNNTSTAATATADRMTAGTVLDVTRRSFYRNTSAADRDSLKTITKVERHPGVVVVFLKGGQILRGKVCEGGVVRCLSNDRTRYTVNGISN